MTLDPPSLLGSRCGSCGQMAYPAWRFCPACASAEEPDQVNLSTSGTVYSYTVVRQAPPGVEVPYVLAYVDLPEGVRVMAQIPSRHLDEVEIGMPVQLALKKVGEGEDGTELIGYEFRPTT